MKNKSILITILVLVLLIGITAYINSSNAGEKKEMEEQAVVVFKADGTECKMGLAAIQKLKEEEVAANLKTNGKPAQKVTYVGVQLKQLIQTAGINTKGKSKVLVKAIDGYSVVLTLAEVLEDKNVYLVYKKDGKPLGKKADGGSGPYQVVILKDSFSQRWCKFVVEIEVQ